MKTPTILLPGLLFLLGACEVGANFDKTLVQRVSVPVPAGSCPADPCAVDIPFSVTAADMAVWHDQVVQSIRDGGQNPDEVTVEIQAVQVALVEANVVSADGDVVTPVTVERWSAALSTPGGTFADLAGAGGSPTPPVVLDDAAVGRTDDAFHAGETIHARGTVRVSVPTTAARTITRASGATLQVKLSWKLHIDVRHSLI